MSRSSEEGYRVFRWFAGLATRRHKSLVALWVLIFVAALGANQVWRAGDVVSYSQSAILPKDTPSAQAQEIIDAQFPGQTANSTATIVLFADNATTIDHRRFAADLHDAIVTASRLPSGGSATLALRNGGTLIVDRRIEFLRDPSDATIYAVYRSFAYELAKEFDPLVHAQIGFTQLAAGIYWGAPSAFVATWVQVPGPAANATAYSATRAAINATAPAPYRPWAEGYFEAFYQGWRASFLDSRLAGLSPPARAETVIAQALPAFLDSPAGTAGFDANQRMFQLGMLAVFRLSNFSNATLVQTYALGAFSVVPVARPAFFADLVGALAENATDADLRAFADNESLAYSPNATPLVLPVDVSRYYVSGDGRIVLMNYAFDREARFVDAEGRQPIADGVLAMRDLAKRLKQAYGAALASTQVYVTGSAPSSLDSELTLGGGAEFIVTIVLVVVLIGLYFRSAVSPVLPILTIAIAIMVANLFVYLIATYVFSVDFTVTAVLQTVLLATGTDYSIFLVSRFRDERRDGKDPKEAVRNSVIWAGESVATSGGAVLISFAALSLGSFSILKGMGLTMGFAVTVALMIALTFIPAVVLLLGNRVFWPSGRKFAKPRAKDDLGATERYFRGAAGFSMRHAKAVVLVAVLITVPATYIVLTDQPSYDFTQGLPPSESSDGITAISGSFGQGLIFPTYVVVVFPRPVLYADGNVSVPRLDALHRLSEEILTRESGVKRIEGPTNPLGGTIDYANLSSMPEAQRTAAILAMAPYIGRDDRSVRLTVVLADEPFSREALDTIVRLIGEIPRIQDAVPELRSARVYVGGVSAVLNDVRDDMGRDLQVMAVVVITGLFVVLLLVLGSVLIPVRAILTILLSIAWTMGLTIVLFHFWKGIDVIFILPLALFVMAMGLGMDYDIFIITRVREEVAKGKSDPEAITEAMTRTGGIISACGVVMAGAFLTLMLNPSPLLQQIGFALAFAILVDSMVVRIYLVPAIMVLAGKYNWWAPGRLQRVRREGKNL